MKLKQMIILSIFIISCTIYTIYTISCTHKTPSALGAWLVIIENGKDISKSQVTYTITKNSISQSVPKVCEETSTLSMTGHEFTTVTTQSNCPWSFPGKKNLGIMSFKGDLLTLTFPEHGKNFSQTLRKQ
jgi:hypothetical protein